MIWKRIFLAAVFAGLAACLGQAQTPASPVLVELFTSEGCSSCPPADRLLIELEQKQPIAGALVVALGEHVDYWDQLGWKDRFSSRAFTERQQQYAWKLRLESPYTPQMVIDGRINVVGNDRAAVARSIAEAARAAKPAGVKLEADAAAVRVAVEHAPGSADVFLAITESDLTTSVRGGENGGRELRHTAVVRRLQRIGKTESGGFRATVPVERSPEWRAGHLNAVVFVQDRSGGAIVGAAATALPENAPAGR